MNWLLYAILTVFCWGLYGVFLHVGIGSMRTEAGPPDANDRMKAFLLVGVAYFLVAVLAPIILLKLGGAKWDFSMKGTTFSFIAGILGAIGALGVLLAFGAKGSPIVVMSIIFAGAPIVNAFAAMIHHPPAGGWTNLRWQFILGIALAALGGYLVTAFKPQPPKPAPASQQQDSVESKG